VSIAAIIDLGKADYCETFRENPKRPSENIGYYSAREKKRKKILKKL